MARLPHLLSVAVLAGGQSRRLGQDKAFVEVGGRPLIVRVLDVVLPMSDDVLIVADDAAKFRHLPGRVVADVYPGMAALGGIYSGLSAARHEQALVVACDMPFLNEGLLRYMIDLARQHEVVIPAWNGYIEPLHAIYHKHCLASMQRLIEAKKLQIAQALCDVPVRYVSAEEIARFDPQRLSFFNINKPEDLDQARDLALKLGLWDRDSLG